jgi:peptidoglycan/LPS O-acetylase OafA/YrhL
MGDWTGAPAPVVQAAVWAGRLSYGSYLFHIAALRLLQTYASSLGQQGVPLAAALLTLFAAWLAYTIWENPWRRFGRAMAARRPACSVC